MKLGEKNQGTTPNNNKKMMKTKKEEQWVPTQFVCLPSKKPPRKRKGREEKEGRNANK